MDGAPFGPNMDLRRRHQLLGYGSHCPISSPLTSPIDKCHVGWACGLHTSGAASAFSSHPSLDWRELYLSYLPPHLTIFIPFYTYAYTWTIFSFQPRIPFILSSAKTNLLSFSSISIYYACLFPPQAFFIQSISCFRQYTLLDTQHVLFPTCFCH